MMAIPEKADTVAAWKLVRWDYDKPGSFLSLTVPGGGAVKPVRYYPHVWAKAEAGGLLVFERRDDAVRFLQVSVLATSDVELWKCHCHTRMVLPERSFATLANWSPRAVERLWRAAQPLMLDVKERLQPWAPGTSAFQEVKLTDKEIVE